MTTEPPATDANLEVLKACETRVWDALVSGDGQADDAALDPDFLGVYSDGFSGKSDHVGQLDNGPTIRSYTLSDLRVIPLSDGLAMLSYRADYQRLTRSEPEAMYVSSIWKRNDTSWVNLFSQDTPAVS